MDKTSRGIRFDEPSVSVGEVVVNGVTLREHTHVLHSVNIIIRRPRTKRGLKVSVRGQKMVIPPALQFVADRLLESTLRPGTADNDINATRNMGMLPQGYTVNHYLTDTDAWFIKTDAPRGFVHFERMPMSTKMEGDFDTGNVRFKARERYSYGYSDPRCVFGSPGA